MNLGYFSYPLPTNEPVYHYAPGSIERKELKRVINELKSQKVDVPMFIGKEEVRTGNLAPIKPPHDISFTLGNYHVGDESHVRMAIASAMSAKTNWSEMPWEERAAIFLKAADLISTKYQIGRASCRERVKLSEVVKL